jgi:hypothetical protein
MIESFEKGANARAHFIVARNFSRDASSCAIACVVRCGRAMPAWYGGEARSRACAIEPKPLAARACMSMEAMGIDAPHAGRRDMELRVVSFV